MKYFSLKILLAMNLKVHGQVVSQLRAGRDGINGAGGDLFLKKWRGSKLKHKWIKIS